MMLCKTKVGYFNLNNCVKIDFYFSENAFASEEYEKWECIVEFDSNKVKLCTFESQADAHHFIGKVQEVVLSKYFQENNFENVIDLTKETNRILEEFCK